MKDLPHHIKKINRQILRSERREMIEEQSLSYSEPPHARAQTPQQIKKQAKTRIAQEHKHQIPVHLSEEERNKKMSKRVPIFDRNNAAPKHAKPSRKKTPRI